MTIGIGMYDVGKLPRGWISGSRPRSGGVESRGHVSSPICNSITIESLALDDSVVRRWQMYQQTIHWHSPWHVCTRIIHQCLVLLLFCFQTTVFMSRLTGRFEVVKGRITNLNMERIVRSSTALDPNFCLCLDDNNGVSLVTKGSNPLGTSV